MTELDPPVSVEFSAIAMRHLDEAYGKRRLPPGGDFPEFLQLLGQAEALYRTFPEVRP